MPLGFSWNVPYVFANAEQPWRPDYPNPPDLRFNYYKLLNDAWAASSAVAEAPGAVTVAVVGAGAAGLTVSRELWRSGYNVRLFEASNRISGRLYTQPRSGAYTAYEWGAMRMPFFNNPKTTPPQQSTNCLLAYYLNQDQNSNSAPIKTFALMNDFPNPGTAPGNTGIYMNQGFGPNDTYTVPTMIPWVSGQQPQNPDLNDVSNKVNDYIGLFTGVVSNAYIGNDASWNTLWQQIGNNYDKLSFSDLVFTAAVARNDYQNDGWFGGFGMNSYESSLFYTIGVGDGSWGAFYAISAMWFIRCVMFGFNSDLQSVSGLNNATSLPFYNSTVSDSNSTPITPPLYRGIQSLCELLCYLQAPGETRSFYTACHANDQSARMYVNSPVTRLNKLSNGTIEVYTGGSTTPAVVANYVVVTAPIWANQLSIEFDGFNDHTELPWQVPAAIQQQHIIASCKVFFPLTKAYWVAPSSIPQVIVTDTFVQDAYGVNWSSNTNDAAILASYTWEDDASKLLPTNNNDLAAMVLGELDRITNDTLGQPISPFVISSGAQVLQWSMQPTYRGCAKLYRQRNWTACYDLLAYNQTYSATSNLYFAGESYGVEGGWTEPALRTAMDAVIHLINNSHGTFLNGFTFNDYPLYDTTFVPDENYPQTSGA